LVLAPKLSQNFPGAPKAVALLKTVGGEER
jgi:hypothetical protein